MNWVLYVCSVVLRCIKCVCSIEVLVSFHFVTYIACVQCNEVLVLYPYVVFFFIDLVLF